MTMRPVAVPAVSDGSRHVTSDGQEEDVARKSTGPGAGGSHLAGAYQEMRRRELELKQRELGFEQRARL